MIGLVVVTTRIEIAAPVECVFDLARNIDVHTQTVWPHTREKAVAGVTSGLIHAGETVTFEATHFGIRQRLTSKITKYEAPYLFIDEMQKGAFKRLRHIHAFEVIENSTVMTDSLYFEAPFGWIGRLTERAVLKAYMRRFLEHRNEKLKILAEQ